MLPLVAALLSEGLSILGNAVMAKGKNVIEEKLGITLPTGESPLTAEQISILRQAEMKHEEWLQEIVVRQRAQELEAEKVQDVNVTERWKADAGADSWLAKNVRPITVIYILTAYFLLAILDGAGVKVASAYVELLGQWGMLVMSAYFGGRTIEKVISIRKEGQK